MSGFPQPFIRRQVLACQKRWYLGPFPCVWCYFGITCFIACIDFINVLIKGSRKPADTFLVLNLSVETMGVSRGNEKPHIYTFWRAATDSAAGWKLTWNRAISSRSRGLVTDSCPEMGLMMKMPVGGWSAPGPVTLYLRDRFLSLSDLIWGSRKQSRKQKTIAHLLRGPPFFGSLLHPLQTHSPGISDLSLPLLSFLLSFLPPCLLFSLCVWAVCVMHTYTWASSRFDLHLVFWCGVSLWIWSSLICADRLASKP